MTNLNVMFHVVVSVYQLDIKFETRPNSLCSSRMAHNYTVGDFTETEVLSADVNKMSCLS